MSDQAAIRFDLQDAGNVQIDIYSITGRLIESSKNYMEAGMKDVPIDASKYENGAYIVNVTTPNQKASVKFIKR
jgi:hypothetical protein